MRRISFQILTLSVKIFYTKSQTEEAVASLATLKKILSRFIQHRVFYELSARGRRSHQVYSVKKSFTVADIDVADEREPAVRIFDADDASHSIEIISAHAMQVYDDDPANGFAVAFFAEASSDFDVRYYLRDEGEREAAPKASQLERISLPQLFEYLEEITSAEPVEIGEAK